MTLPSTASTCTWLSFGDAKADEFTGGKFKPWHIHNLRRTCVVETAMNRVSGTKAGIVGVYQRSQHREAVKAAFNAWGAYIESLIAGTGDAGLQN